MSLRTVVEKCALGDKELPRSLVKLHQIGDAFSDFQAFVQKSLQSTVAKIETIINDISQKIQNHDFDTLSSAFSKLQTAVKLQEHLGMQDIAKTYEALKNELLHDLTQITQKNIQKIDSTCQSGDDDKEDSVGDQRITFDHRRSLLEAYDITKIQQNIDLLARAQKAFQGNLNTSGILPVIKENHQKLVDSMVQYIKDCEQTVEHLFSTQETKALKVIEKYVQSMDKMHSTQIVKDRTDVVYDRVGQKIAGYTNTVHKDITQMIDQLSQGDNELDYARLEEYIARLGQLTLLDDQQHVKRTFASVERKLLGYIKGTHQEIVGIDLSLGNEDALPKVNDILNNVNKLYALRQLVPSLQQPIHDLNRFLQAEIQRTLDEINSRYDLNKFTLDSKEKELGRLNDLQQYVNNMAEANQYLKSCGFETIGGLRARAAWLSSEYALKKEGIRKSERALEAKQATLNNELLKLVTIENEYQRLKERDMIKALQNGDEDKVREYLLAGV